MKEKRIHPQNISTSRQAAELLDNTKASDNFRNLFEVPVLFYVACIVAYLTQAETVTLVSLAWTFVILRAVHSAIHCTYNRVVQRFAVYVISTLVVFAMWGVLGATLLRGSA